MKRAIQLIGFVLGAGAVAATALGLRRIHEWETLSPHDADDGEFVTLSDGARMHYVARPSSASAHSASVQDKPDVILIHGMMDSAQNWKGNIDALARHYRVWAVDLIGFGYSSRLTRAAYSLGYYARTIREFMDAHGIGRAHLVGHSLGGAVALEAAAEFPARVGKLVLINPALYLLNALASLNLFARVPLIPRAVVGLALTSRTMRDYAFKNALGNPARFDPAYAAWRRQPTRVKGTAQALVALAASWSRTDLQSRLHEIVAPALVLVGENDAVVPPRHGARIARALKKGRVVIAPGMGHILFEEEPQIVNQLVLDFLRDSSTER